MLQDLRYFLRQASQHPGFVLTAVLSLALGIGATTAVFSVIYAGLLHPYPYRDSERIVRTMLRTKVVPRYDMDFTGPQIAELQKLPIVESLFAMDFRNETLTGAGVPQNVIVIALNSNGFSDLGVPPLLGRGLLPSDAPEGQDPQPVAVLSYKFWREHFLSDPNVLGKTVEVDHQTYSIIGVAPPRFTWYIGDLWVPLKLTQDPVKTYIVDLRLKPGVTFAGANAALEPLLREFAKEMPKHYPDDFKVDVEDLNAWVSNNLGTTLYLLLAAVVSLLVIGCGNVSILLLARGTARQHELALRAALGAQRGQIARQLLTESLLLATAGVALGIVLSYGMLRFILALLPPRIFAPEVVIAINLPILFFSIALALASGILFGLWPALRLSRAPLSLIVQSNGRRVAGTVSGRRAHSALIAGQIALRLLLLAAAGSAIQGFSRFLHMRLGYDPHNIMSVPIPIHEGAYSTWAGRAAFFEQMRAAVAEVPGVTMTAISSNGTPPHSGFDMPIEVLGGATAQDKAASVNLVSAEYFAALRIPLIAGQLWNEAQSINGAHVAVVNRTLARRYFPNGDAIGHSVKATQIEDRPPEVLSVPKLSDSWLQIIGVVDDVLDEGLRKPIIPAVYIPYTLAMWRFTQILVRSNEPPMTLLPAVEKQIAKVDPDQQAFSIVQDLDTWISDTPEWEQEHLAAWIFGGLAWLALALAAIGLYSVVSYTVAQRTGEFGIRMALGAQRGSVIRIAFASTLWSVAAGVAGGLALILAMNSVLAQWVENNSRSPMILLAGILLLSLAAAIACAIPARRASQADPMSALRSE